MECFSFHKFFISIVEHFLQISHNLSRINGQTTRSTLAVKRGKSDTLAKLFQALRSRHVSLQRLIDNFLKLL